MIGIIRLDVGSKICTIKNLLLENLTKIKYDDKMGKLD
jgi:hypothetical protein